MVVDSYSDRQSDTIVVVSQRGNGEQSHRDDSVSS